MAKDFRADRIRTGALIGSASVGQPGILIYSASVANDYDGNRTDSAMLSSVGRDVGVFVSGSKGHMVGNEWYPLNTAAHASDFKAGVFLVGGDFHVSGTIRAEHIVAELDPTATGSLYLSGALYVGKGATINTWSGTDEHHDFKVMGENYLGGETILFADSGTGKVSIGGSSATGAGRQPGVPIGTLELGSGSTGDSNLVIHSSNAKSSSIEFWHGGTVGARISQSGSGGSEDLYIDNLAVGEATIFRSTISSPGHPSESMRITGGSSAKDVAVSVGGAAVLTASVFQVDAFNGFNRTGILVNTEQNSTSYPGIKVYAPATVGAVINANYGLSVTQNASSGYAASFFRNQAEAGSQPLVSITEENASNTQIALKIRQDGTGDILGLYDSTTEVFVVEDGGKVGIGTRAGKAAYNLDVGFDAFSARDVGLRLECHSAQSASISFSGHSTAVGPAIVYEGTSTTGDGNFVIVHSSSNKEIRIKNHNDTMFARFREPVDDKAQVLILSGGGFLSSDPSTYADANFVVSGSVNSRTGSTRGTAVFMGDMHVSGNISSDLTNFGQWGRTTLGGAHLYPLQAPTDSIAIGKTSALASPGTADIYLSSSGHAVFNERGNNVDFRVESNNETHMLFVTASDRIGIGTSNPGGFLSVNTNTQAAGVRRGVHLGHDYGGDTYSAKEDSPTLTVRWLKNAVKDTNVFIESAEANSASILLKNYDSLGAIGSAAGLVHGRETAGSGAKTLTLVNSQSSGGDLLFKAGSSSTHPSTMLRMRGAGSGVNSKVTFNENQADLDFLVKSSNRPGAIFLDCADNQLFILSGSTSDSSSPDEAGYADVAFFVSGTRGTKDSITKGTALFGGDLVSSGSIYANNKLFVGVGQTGNKPGSKPGTAQIYDVLGPELSLSKTATASGSLYFRNSGDSSNTVGMKLSYTTAETGLLALTGSDSLDKDFIFKVNSSEAEGTGTDTEIMRFDASANSIGIGGVTQATGSKVEILVNDAEDKGGLKIDFNETGAKIALEVDSEAGMYAIKSTGKFPAQFIQDISSGYGLGVIRNIAEAGSLPLVNFQEDNTAGEQPVLRVTQDGTGNIIELKDGATQVFTVADGGHVGIKNDYPVADLVVGGGSTAHSIHIDAGNGQSGSLAFSKNGGTPGARISYNSNEDLVIAMTGSNGNNKDIIFQTNASGTDTEVFRVDGSESTVAIGATSNNTAKLLVKVESTENHHGIKIDQDDTGERALWIDSEGQAAYVTCKEGIQVIVDQDDGYGFLTSRNKSTVSDPLVKIRDQLGDQSALKVIQESKDSDAYAIEIGNIGGTTTSISGSGQVGIGVGNSTYDAILHIKGIERGDGIVLEDADSSDTVVKIYESTDDGVVDVYANNSVTARIHGNGTSFVPNPFGVGVTTPEAELEVKNADSGEDATVMITARADRSGSIAFRKGVTSSTAAAVVLDSDEHLNLINSGSSKNIILETTSGQIIASGTLMAPSGLSGSLTHLSDGTSYLIAGSNITISTGSSGAVTVASAADILGVTAGTGLSGGGTSGTVTLNIDNSVVATISGSTFTGATKHTAGLSGSLTHLSDGTPYLRPGNNITIESGSAGYITITAADGGDTAASYLVLSATSSLDSERVFTAGTGISATDGGAGGAYTLAVDNSTVATLTGSQFSGNIGATGSLGITGNAIFGNGSSLAGNDNNFFVSGSKGSANGNIRGTAVFGGDVHISGSITSDNTTFGQWSDGGSFIYPADSSGAETVIIGGTTVGAADIVLGSDGATQFNKQNAAVDFRVRSENKSYMLFVDGDKDAVTVGRQNLFGDDAFLNVSGSILSRGVTSDRGLAVFGGDTYVSGALLLSKLGTTPSQANIGSDNVGLYAKEDSGTTKLFYMDDAGTEVQVGSGGGGGGPGDANATFLLVSATGSLNAERVLAGGAGISTTDGGAGNSFTVAVDYAGADSFILAATDGTGITVDGDNDKLVIYDNDAAVVKYVNAGQVGKTYTAGDGLDLSGTEFSLDLKSSGGLVIDSTELAVSNAVVATLTGSQFSGNVGVTGSFGVTGGALFKGNVTLGNATGDDLTFTGYAASNIIPKTDNTYDLGSSGNRWANIYTGDLHLRNDKGNWTIQEDSDKLIVINNLTGKKYKMMLSPLEDEE